MNALAIPAWVKEAVQTKLDRSDFGFAHKGRYEIYVEREECGRFECTVDIWRACIDAATLDDWDHEKDPTKQRERVTWKDFNIEQL